jgi:hypothetical protein
MNDMNRVIDKYADQKFCDLDAEAQKEYLGAFAQRAASEVLKQLGLDDESAAADLRDVRDLLRGFRVVRKTAMTTVLGGVGRVAGWIIVIILAGLILHSETGKKLASTILQ